MSETKLKIAKVLINYEKVKYNGMPTVRFIRTDKSLFQFYFVLVYFCKNRRI